MVHTGPSVGCHRCRQRHVKCDLAKPHCQRCSTINVQCPGYRDHGGFVFRDQTLKSSRKKKGIARDDRSQIETRVRNNQPQAQTIAITIKDDPATTSINFFFTSFLGITRDPTTSRGHFTDLIKFYSEGSPSSPIVLAAQYMAAQTVAHTSRSYTTATIYLDKLHLDATRSLRTAICNVSQESLHPTILATLCLDFADQVSHRSLQRQITRNPVHIHGALALLQQWPHDLDQQAKKMLAAATTSACVQLAIDQNDGERYSSVSKLSALSKRSAAVVGSARELDDMVADVLRISQYYKSGTRIQLVQSLNELDSQSLQWRRAVPIAWSALLLLEHESAFSLDATYIFSQWCCLRLMLLKLRLVLTGHTSCNHNTTESIHEMAKDTMRMLRSSSTCLFKTATRIGDQDRVLAHWFLERTLRWALWILNDFVKDAERLKIDHASIEYVEDLRMKIDSTVAMP